MASISPESKGIKKKILLRLFVRREELGQSLK
jgi:hypothetical protein